MTTKPARAPRHREPTSSPTDQADSEQAGIIDNIHAPNCTRVSSHAPDDSGPVRSRVYDVIAPVLLVA